MTTSRVHGQAAGGPVVYATDFSPASRPAFRTALSLAKTSRASLVIVHVVAPLVQVPDAAVVSPPTYARFLDAVESAARRHLDRLVARARAAGVRSSGVVVDGTPDEEIVRASRLRHARTIVIGTHGRTGLRRALIGSVAARVVAQADCPVLTVRAAVGTRKAR